MTSINIDTQLNTFDLIKSILKTSSNLSKHTIYNFEPREKSSNFKGFPYIVVRVPEDDDDEKYIGNHGESKEFDIEIQLHLAYDNKDKYTGNANAIISTLRQAQTSFQNSGYSLESINQSVQPEPTVSHQKLKLVGEFQLILKGDVLL